jgi:hypothetical protein
MSKKYFNQTKTDRQADYTEVTMYDVPEDPAYMSPYVIGPGVHAEYITVGEGYEESTSEDEFIGGNIPTDDTVTTDVHTEDLPTDQNDVDTEDNDTGTTVTVQEPNSCPVLNPSI